MGLLAQRTVLFGLGGGDNNLNTGQFNEELDVDGLLAAVLLVGHGNRALAGILNILAGVARVVVSVEGLLIAVRIGGEVGISDSYLRMLIPLILGDSPAIHHREPYADPVAHGRGAIGILVALKALGRDIYVEIVWLKVRGCDRHGVSFGGVKLLVRNAALLFGACVVKGSAVDGTAVAHVLHDFSYQSFFISVGSSGRFALIRHFDCSSIPSNNKLIFTFICCHSLAVQLD